MKNYLSELKPEGTFHVYNRSVGKEKLFKQDANYLYFLIKYRNYIQPICDTYCYCLLPTHFHFLIRCRNEKDIEKIFLEKCKNISLLKSYNESSNQEKENILSDFMSLQFSHFFNAYSKAFNKQEGRHGALFSRPFNRIEVKEENYLKKIVHYIHHNPVEAGLCKTPSEWKWSSYNKILSEDDTFLCRNETIEWFDNKSNFRTVHEQSGFFK